MSFLKITYEHISNHQLVRNGNKPNQQKPLKACLKKWWPTLIAIGHNPCKNSMIVSCGGSPVEYIDLNSNFSPQSSHFLSDECELEPEIANHSFRQSWWMNLIEPLHLHGWNKGRSGSLSPWQIRQHTSRCCCDGSGEEEEGGVDGEEGTWVAVSAISVTEVGGNLLHIRLS